MTNQTPSTSLLTDHYELTMLSGAIKSGLADHQATFEVFTRKLPAGKRYGVLAGLGRLLPLIEKFTFNPDDITYLVETGVINTATAEYLTTFKFTGDIHAYQEGDIFFPNSPVFTVEGKFGECVILETLILSILNHDSAIATTAARMVHAAKGRPIIEMGSRRTHEQSAVAAARAAYITGFASTSNLAAGKTYGIPTVGTAAHAYTLAHPDETTAFRNQIASQSVATTLLVDTYSIDQGIRNAVTAAQETGAKGPGAIRIDSGDLNEEARKARMLLNSLGATETKITVTSDLDEYVMTDLADAPISGYGVGTRLVTPSPIGFVYKLVAIADKPGPAATLRPVAKKASGKKSIGGRKTVYRETDENNKIVREVFTVNNNGVAFKNKARNMQIPVVLNGETIHNPTLNNIRNHHKEAIKELSETDLNVTDGTPTITAELLPAVKKGYDIPMETHRALLVVDVQNDFVEGGALGVDGGTRTATKISEYINKNNDSYDVIIASKDSHDPESTNQGHFAEPGTEPDFIETWPVHCVTGTKGSEYAPELDTSLINIHIRKGMGEPAYSMFEGTDDENHTLADILNNAGITDLDVVGIATDYCVKATAFDGNNHSFNVHVLKDFIAGVASDSSEKALKDMTAVGITVR